MEVFKKTFQRNSMWSKKKPCPDFLMASMSIDETKKFFRFWDSFDSWRVFSQYDEYDASEAGDRYERRYMEKENKVGQKKYLKEERSRIFKLVELARKHHPLLIQE